MKKVIILGGGFAGVAAALILQKKAKELDLEITLIDRNSFHVFTPSLYEVATSEEPQKNIAIPYATIFNKSVSLIKRSVEKVDTNNQEIILSNQERIPYDYLIFALGSQPAYYGIPGLKEHSYVFKSLADAVRIKNTIKTLCCKEGVCQRKVQVIIGGAGFAGTELAAEILTYKHRLATQNGLDRNCLELTLIQGSHRVLNELDEQVSAVARKRLLRTHVHFAFGGHIKEVTDKDVLTDDGKAYPYDILIWTGGVEANHIAAKSDLPVNKRGQLLVNNYLQIQHHETLFAAGDSAGYIDPKTQKTVPNVAQVAEDQGKVAGENIIKLIQQKSLISYKYQHYGYIVPLRGRFAVAELTGNIHLRGIIGWMLQQIVFLRYLLGILPFTKALSKWNTFELDLEQS